MSTGCECRFIEVAPGKWYYLLEQGSAPKNAWDWREYADLYGPFATFDAAYENLHDFHANPGGFSRHGYQDGDAERIAQDEVMQRLLKAATLPSRTAWGLGSW